MANRLCEYVLRACLATLPVIGVLWILAVPSWFDLTLVTQQAIGFALGIAAAAAFLKHPYGGRAGALDLLLALAAIASWTWMAGNHADWLMRMAERTPDMWVPGVLALLLMMEALRKSVGLAIAGLVWILIGYAFFGGHLPGLLQAEVFPPTKTVLYLYADINGVPGIVLRVIFELVLAFILFGKLMEMSGALDFFNNLALGWMGHRRGGPAKVAVVASAAFGTLSGSTVANIMSTGIVTIPLMKKSGYRAEHAAAIEAVASNGGQIAPPVMGATAFIIAEFLEVPYGDVALAALVPAALYFLVLFLQVDALAVRHGVRGLPRAELPSVARTLAAGWVFLFPIALLVYYLFFLGYSPGLAAIYAAGAVFVLLLFKRRGVPRRADWASFFLGGGANLVPLILIGGGAGVIMGVLNSTGLAFQLSLVLTAVGEAAGIFWMLLLTALICIVLGMGMPTAAVYIVLVAVVAPALVDMGLVPIGAHLFLFYFGLLSMLTPPVAVASMVAAELAGSNMWRTGWLGVQLAITAFLVPFLWAFNPALLLQGTWTAIVIVLATCVVAGLLLGQMVRMASPGWAGKTVPALLLAAALLVGSATVWTGPESLLALLPAAFGAAVLYALHQRGRGRGAVVLEQSVPLQK